MPIALIVVSAAVCLLAVYQWRELLEVQAGGSTACAIDATFNCATVWGSSFAKQVHGLTRVPLAGWGLVWGFAALASSFALHLATRAGRGGARVAAPVWVVGAAGVAACVVFLGVSATLGTFCLTCLGTYLLVAGYFGLVLKLPRPVTAELGAGLARAAVFVVAGYLVVLVPGLDTPVEGARSRLDVAAVGKKAAGPAAEPVKSTGDLLGDYLLQLPEATKPLVAGALAAYRAAPPAADASKWPTRRLIGAATAAVRIVEFSDIRCGHCKMMSEALAEISQNTSPGALSLELRQFPLDGTCNKHVNPQMVDSSGARCTAAKALICMEPLSGFRRAQERMFDEQERLTRDRVLEIAIANGAQLEHLMRCIEAPDTAAKLEQDLAYAMAFRIEGTPLVLINGKEAAGLTQFVYAMVLAGGDVGASGWGVLPPPPPPGSGDGHEGHGH